MTSADLVQKLLKEVRDLRQQGVYLIDADKLEQALSSSSLIDDADYQKLMLELRHQSSLAEYQNNHEWGFRLFEAVIRFSEQAIKSAILINGGAAVGVLTFIGHTPPHSLPREYGYGLLCFVLGALFAAATTSVSYLAQSHYQRAIFQQKPAQVHGDRLRIVAMVFMLLSYILFCLGILCTYLALAS